MLAYCVRNAGSAQMLDLVAPMGAVLLSWLLLFLLFSGLGIGILKLMRQPLASGSVWLDSFWLGWALSLGLMQIWHLAFPINDALVLIFALVAAVSLMRQRQNGLDALKSLRGSKLPLLVFALLAIWFSNRALGMPIAYDTGYRDIQAVLWIDAYPIVPGLGNLFWSLAFNQSVYLYDALLDTSIWSGQSVYICTGLLLVVYLAQAFNGAARLARSHTAEDLRWSSIFSTLTLPFILFQAVRWGGITHFLTDTVVDLIGFLTVIYLLDFLQFWRAARGSRDYHLYRLAIIIIIGCTIKQSFVVFGLASAAFVVAVWARRGGLRTNPIIVLPILLFALAVLLPWMARGFITSGYAAYPQSIGRIELDWTMPKEQVELRQRTLATNTRLRGADPEEVLASWEWLRPWLQKLLSNFFPTLLPTVISVVAIALHLAASGKRPRGGQAPGVRWHALIPLMIMLLFWFFTVPNDKYVRYVFWSFAALSSTMAALAWHWIAWRRRVLALFALVLLCLAYVAYLIVRHDEVIVPAGANNGFHALIQPAYEEFVTDDGTIINHPTRLNQCWQVPLPCTPYPHAGISARVPGELSHGFRMNVIEDAASTDD
jgi:uncharacterized protein YceK